MAFQIPSRPSMDGIDPKNVAVHNDIYDKLQQLAEQTNQSQSVASTSPALSSASLSGFIAPAPSNPGDGWVECKGQYVRLNGSTIKLPNLSDAEITIDGGSPVKLTWYYKT